MSETFFIACPLDVEKERLPRPPTREEIEAAVSNGGNFEHAGEEIDVWKLVIFDPSTNTRYCYRMDDVLRKELIKKLTGGVVMATSIKQK